MKKATRAIIALPVVSLFYFVCAYQNIWHASSQEAHIIEALYLVPALLLVYSWIWFPSLILGGLLSLAAFLLPRVASHTIFTPVVVIDILFAVVLFIVTAFVVNGPSSKTKT